MDANILVHKREAVPFTLFFEDNDFDVEYVTESVIQATRHGEEPVIINSKDGSLYFQVDLGSVKEVASQDLFQALLDLNTEILPVSSGIDSSDAEDPHLVLVESREADNLDENELLSVISALEIAVDKVSDLLGKHLEKGE